MEYAYKPIFPAEFFPGGRWSPTGFGRARYYIKAKGTSLGKLQYSNKVINLAKKYRIKLDNNTIENIKNLISTQKKAKKLRIRITTENSKGQKIYKTNTELLKNIKKRIN